MVACKFIENCTEMFDKLDESLKCVGQLVAPPNCFGEFARTWSSQKINKGTWSTVCDVSHFRKESDLFSRAQT